jgi:hypothetical protein
MVSQGKTSVCVRVCARGWVAVGARAWQRVSDKRADRAIQSSQDNAWILLEMNVSFNTSIRCRRLVPPVWSLPPGSSSGSVAAVRA